MGNTTTVDYWSCINQVQLLTGGKPLNRSELVTVEQILNKEISGWHIGFGRIEEVRNYAISQAVNRINFLRKREEYLSPQPRTTETQRFTT